MRIFELLGIVLLRFPLIPRLWVIALISVNAASLFFLHTHYGQVALAAVLAGVTVIAVIYLRMGFVRLLGIGHIFWIPMLPWFTSDLPDPAAEPWLYNWLIALLVLNAISLVIDTIDVARFILGERQPYYRW